MQDSAAHMYSVDSDLVTQYSAMVGATDQATDPREHRELHSQSSTASL